MRRRQRSPVSAVLAVLALAAAGCGPQLLKIRMAEDQIRTEVAAQIGATVAEVECPEPIEAERGGTFECTATGGDGTTAKIKVTQTDDRGNIRFHAPLLHTGEAERQLASALTKQMDADVEVTCPDLVVVTPGKRLSCKAADGRGAERSVRVTVKDSEGNLDYELR